MVNDSLTSQSRPRRPGDQTSISCVFTVSYDFLVRPAKPLILPVYSRQDGMQSSRFGIFAGGLTRIALTTHPAKEWRGHRYHGRAPIPGKGPALPKRTVQPVATRKPLCRSRPGASARTSHWRRGGGALTGYVVSPRPTSRSRSPGKPGRRALNHRNDEALLGAYHPAKGSLLISIVRIPTRCRPSFRFDVGHHSDVKPATVPINHRPLRAAL